MAAKTSAARKHVPEPVLASVHGMPGGGTASLDRVIHERLRLAIVGALAVYNVLTFAELKELLGTADGNLSVHSRKLEDAGYITVEKKFEGRVPRTEYRLTTSGRTALERYLTHMETLIHATRNG